MNQLLSIGQFARASGLSQRALRIYDTEGLLKPAQVDEANGYRYYEQSQLAQAELISTARTMNMPLEEIRRLLSEDPPEAHERLDRFWDQAIDRFRTIRVALGKLHQAIDQRDDRRIGMDAFEEGNRLYFRERNLEEALKRYLEVERSDPNYATARRYIGHNIYGREWGRWQEGIPFLEDAQAIAPDNPKVLEDIGRAYVAVGKIEEGRQLLERANTPLAARALKRLQETG